MSWAWVRRGWDNPGRGVSAERAWMSDRRVGGAARFCDAELMALSKEKAPKLSIIPSGPITLVHKSSDVSNVLPSVPTEDNLHLGSWRPSSIILSGNVACYSLLALMSRSIPFFAMSDWSGSGMLP